MRIAVTGAKGFVGGTIARLATDMGHEVTAIDDESRGLNDVSFCNYIKHDCRRGLPDGLEADVVVHMAAATGSLERPIEELREFNVGMALTVYEDALKAGAGCFIWPTTSLALAVPDSPYVISKEEGLEELKAADQDNGILVPLRFFNLTGAYHGISEKRKNEVHIIPRLVQCFKTGEKFVINGGDWDTQDGTPSRDYTNVLDVARYALVLMGEKITGGLDGSAFAKDGAIWAATGECTTAQQVLNIARLWLGDINYTKGPRRPYDCGALHVDPAQRDNFANTLGGSLTPSAVSIRDELLELACCGLF